MEEMFDCPICGTDKSIAAIKMGGVKDRKSVV
jgi:hypothetical protein